MLEKISLLIQNSIVSFPRILLSNYKKIGLTEKDTLFLIYLINEKSLIFNPTKIGSDLNLTFAEVLDNVSLLTDKDLIEIQMVKENNIHQIEQSILSLKILLFLIFG